MNFKQARQTYNEKFKEYPELRKLYVQNIAALLKDHTKLQNCICDILADEIMDIIFEDSPYKNISENDIIEKITP